MRREAIAKPESQAPFKKGDEVYIDHRFHNDIGGKRAIVESCEWNADFSSEWAVKITVHPRPIDSGWLIKIPKQ